MWKLKPSKKFIKQYKKLDSETLRMADKAMSDIISSANPADLGTYKQNMRVFSYNLGRKHRIIYSVHYGDGTVEFLHVCDHKSAYGQD